jgi:hypothetical protein
MKEGEGNVDGWKSVSASYTVGNLSGTARDWEGDGRIGGKAVRAADGQKDEYH